jgi:subtilisin family serine protease
MRILLNTVKIFTAFAVAVSVSISTIGTSLADGGKEPVFKTRKTTTKKTRKPKPKATRKSSRKKTKTKRSTRKSNRRKSVSVVSMRHRNLTASNRREIIIDFPSDITSTEIDAFSRRYNLSVISQVKIDLLDVLVIKFFVRKTLDAGQTFRLNDERRFLVPQPNFRYYLSGAPARQYALKMMKVSQAQKISTGNGVKIAILDTGIYSNHPAIAGTVSKNFDVIGKSARKNTSHGTGIASIIAAHKTITGISPGAKVLSIRVFASKKRNRQQYAETYNLLIAVDWAIKNNAKILNMSFAGLKKDPLFHRILQVANKKGLILVASAGNLGPKNPVAYPAAFKEVIAATAIDAKNRLYRWANRGDQIALAAPGVNIMVARKTRSFGLMSGTSAATAYVSGTIALLLQAEPDLNTTQVLDRLAKTATDLGRKGRDKQFGFGLLNPYRALRPQP